MKEQDLIRILNKLKSITPKDDFAKKSKEVILSSSKISGLDINRNPAFSRTPIFSFSNISEIIRISTLTGVAAFLLLFLLGGVSYINKNFSPLGLEGLSQKSLVTEAEEINNSIEITLNQINYLDQSNKTAINKIDEVSKNSPISASPAESAAIAEETSLLSATAAADEDISTFLINASSTKESADIEENGQANQEINNLLDQLSE